MSVTTNPTITIDLTAKTKTLSGRIAYREMVVAILVNTGDAAPSDLLLRIMRGSTEMARCADFVAVSGGFEGQVDMDTANLLALFTGQAHQCQKRLNLQLWDMEYRRLLINDSLDVMNNPWKDTF